MNRSITRKLEMATRIQEFQQAHPFSDRNQATIAAQFAARLAQAQSLCLAEHKQRLAANAATRHRQDLRRRLETRVMRGVVRVGAFATRGDVQVSSRFLAPRQGKSNAAFLARASSLLEVARAHQDALTRSGLTRSQLSEFAAGVSRFREATAQAQTSRRQYGETRAALKRAIVDLSELLRLLDVFNRDLFQDDELFASMWTKLRTVARTGARRRGEGTARDVPPVPVVMPVITPNQPARTVSGSGDEEPPRDGGLNEAA